MNGGDPENTLHRDQQIDEICDQFEQAWKQGEPPALEQYLEQVSESLRPRLAGELWAIECHHDPSLASAVDTTPLLHERHPMIAAWVEQHSTLLRPPGSSDAGSPDQRATIRMAQASGSAALHIRCPHCSNPVELLDNVAADDVSCTNCGSQFSLVDDSEKYDTTGQSLKTLGRFELLARLGVGGFGTVWKAHDTELDRIVAVKIPRKGNLNTLEVEQFLREARAAAQLRHPNIVPVFEVGREDKTIFIVSEFVQGTSLADWMKQQRRPANAIARICASVTEALTEAHSAGIVHRDLKPSNIMLDMTGKPRLMDFGLAKREIGEVTMTLDGFVVGTPAYMSPEQARGEGHWTDQRTDIYSLGVMLFHLLTNELPFRGSPAMQIQARLTTDPPQPRSLDPSVPRDLATICLKCMEVDPNRRYQTAAAVGDELRRYLDGRPVLARPLPAVARGWRWVKRHPALSAALFLGIVLAIGGPTLAVVIDGQRREIARRLDERSKLVTQREQQRIELQNELATLNARLASITGSPASDAPHEAWRTDLVRSLLDQRYEDFATQADEQPTTAAAAAIHQALGDLLATVDRPQQAIAEYQAAWQAYAESPDEGHQLARLETGLALAGLLQQSGKGNEARQLLDELSPLLTQQTSVAELEYLQQRYSAEAEDSTKNQLFLKAGAVSEQLRSHWPTEAAAVPALRDQLLPRTRPR